MKAIVFFVAFLSCICSALSDHVQQGNSRETQAKGTLFLKPFPGLVPDAETAEAIAKLVVGKLVATSPSAPYEFKATLRNDSWVLYSYTPEQRRQSNDFALPATIIISKLNGKIIYVRVQPG